MSDKIQRALISVFNKTGILEFAKFLQKQNIKIISTGGTAKLLKNNGVKVKEISALTEFPEMLDGRVKTLHPKVHGGLLYVRNNKEHEDTIKKHDILPIDLVVVNLYDFENTVKNPDKSFEDKIEMIDIGGPSMLRSAAKNYQSVTVISDIDDLEKVQQEIEKSGNTKLETRKYLAGKVFSVTAKFDSQVAKFLNPNFFSIFGEKVQKLRYGENPHQKADFYRTSEAKPSIANAKQLHGKELSYNNILDADAALTLTLEFANSGPFAAVLKHTNPCGAAIAKTIEEAFKKAHQVDPLSAYGGIVALNKECNEKTAKLISESGFFEIIIAPEYNKKALEILTKKKNVRILEIGKINKIKDKKAMKSVIGGILEQNLDTKTITEKDLQIAVGKKPSKETMDDLLFAWKAVKNIKSNAILLVKNGVMIGMGAGQTSRVGSMKIALEQAGGNAKGSICASDAFFPFSDSIEEAAKAGIEMIIQPGGSIRDQEVFDAAKKHGITMVLTGTRSFKH